MENSESLYKVMVGKPENSDPGVDGKEISEDGMYRAGRD
jgi:hypothetical protein